MFRERQAKGGWLQGPTPSDEKRLTQAPFQHGQGARDGRLRKPQHIGIIAAPMSAGARRAVKSVSPNTTYISAVR